MLCMLKPQEQNKNYFTFSLTELVTICYQEQIIFVHLRSFCAPTPKFWSFGTPKIFMKTATFCNLEKWHDGYITQILTLHGTSLKLLLEMSSTVMLLLLHELFQERTLHALQRKQMVHKCNYLLHNAECTEKWALSEYRRLKGNIHHMKSKG